ncbi:ferredoxin [Desulforamulus aquiferis]|uniref:Ferredoxin n=1 Tax=Desulforamulus aquiferis TaxID=1397668 RepID=A0AAW7Z992_9FIRM|nr:ferredoxin [Desulforamulus aquiferis]MDO7785937.1 ferredoxin [Desulforamulus aquiferis]RYD02074.1 ferredoxin [Desulforamulus aquiferis]
MKTVVDQDLCISCGACIDVCPEVYEWNDDDKAHAIVDEVPEGQEDSAKEAAESCPTEAIKVN